MEIKEKHRSEIEDKYKWDLTLIYKTDSAWLEEYKNLSIIIKKIEQYKGKILESAQTLKEVLDTYFELDRKLEKLYMYAHLNNDSDTRDGRYKEMHGQIRNLLKEFNEKSTYIEPELLEKEYSLIEDYMEEIKELKIYEKYLVEIFRFKDHILSEPEENILSSLGNLFSSPSNIYDQLVDADMNLGTIKDENGNDVELSDRNYSKYIGSKNREVRISAFNTMYSSYKNFVNTIASTLKAEVDANVTISRLKKYKTARQMALYSDNVDESVYDNLIDTTSKGLPSLFKYYDLRKTVLGISEMHLYDLYTPLVAEQKKEYSFEQAKELVLEALKPLGKEYSEMAKTAFEERWVDVYSNTGKRSGAFSSGGYDTKPYFLLNFQGEAHDVSTMAHELGHSMHSYYSIQNNEYPNYQYKIFVAEVASTVNELLLVNYLLKNTKNKEEKLYILNQLMELFKGTIFRQVMFAEFEKQIYEADEKGTILTPEYLSEIYYKLNEKYFKDAVIIDKEIQYEWARIPHFYMFFYVYKYAIGLSAACYIVNNILEEKPNAVENYLEFLKTGGSDYPIEELKIAGVDMNKKEVIESAITMFDSTIEEFKQLYNE